jgi:protein SCO1/2
MKKHIGIFIFLIVTSLLSVWLFYKGVISTTDKSQTDSFDQKAKEYSIELKSKLPAPGTYQLHKIFTIPELKVLDSTGTKQPITKYTKGKITLLTFFYERCSDVNGCPYAMSLFHRVKSTLDQDDELRDRIRFVHISFDPDRDTPMMMAGLEKNNANSNKNKKEIEWDFLTTSSIDALLPVVDAFGQNVDIDMSTITKNKVLSYSHVLKVFLIDEEGDVREIYSTLYLSKDMLLNDIKTLTLDQK